MRNSLLRKISQFSKTIARLLPNFAGLALAWGFLAYWTPDPPWKHFTWPGMLWIWAATTLVVDRTARRQVTSRLGANSWFLWFLGAAFAAGLTCTWLLWIPAGTALIHWIVPMTGALLGFALRGIYVGTVRLTRSLRGEALRWSCVLGVAMFAIHPYATRGLVGGGDAQHYAQQLADSFIQVHEGVFPLFVGQSIYAYNGDIHPLRTAPYFQYVGVGLNWLTGNSLGPAGVQNLLIVLSFLAGGLITYVLLVRVGGSIHAWSACLLTIAFLSSPGVLSLIYSGDMVASWMTLPYLPVLIYGLMRTGEKEVPAGIWLLVAAPFAVLWLAHAPIAFWVSPLVVFCLIVFAFRHWTGGRGFWQAAGAGTFACALSAYVFVSVATLELPDDPNLIKVVREGGVMDALRTGAAGWLKPVDPSASLLLHNLQLSPVLWLAVVLGLAGAWKMRRIVLPLWAYFAILLLLVYPTGVAARIWAVMPAIVIGATEKWPMQRFYPILSVLVPFMTLAGLRLRWCRSTCARWTLGGLFAVGCAYSLGETAKFVRRGRDITLPVTVTQQRLREENAVLSRYSYEYYGRLPRYFSHGPMAPFLQNRLLATESLEIVTGNLGAIADPSSGASAATTLHAFERTGYGGRFTPKLRLEPDQVYGAIFDLGPKSPQGVFELTGRTFYRQYPVSSGVESHAFSDGPGQPHGFALWTTAAKAEEVEVRFYLAPGQPAAEVPVPLRLITINRHGLPLRLQRLIPYELALNASQDSWLETPKIFLPGYVAMVDGRPTRPSRSPDGLVMIPVTAGQHEVILSYRGPWILRAAFWFTGTAWFVLLALTVGPRRLRSIWRNGQPAALIRVGQVGVALTAAFVIAAGVNHLLTRPVSPSVLAASERFSLRVAFPVERAGLTETLARTQRGSHTFALFAHYLNGQHVVLGFARDGVPWMTSAPIPINYVLPHSLDINWGGTNAISERYRIAIDHRVAVDRLIAKESLMGQAAPTASPFNVTTPLLPEFTGRVIANRSLRPAPSRRETGP